MIAGHKITPSAGRHKKEGRKEGRKEENKTTIRIGHGITSLFSALIWFLIGLSD